MEIEFKIITLFVYEMTNPLSCNLYYISSFTKLNKQIIVIISSIKFSRLNAHDLIFFMWVFGCCKTQILILIFIFLLIIFNTIKEFGRFLKSETVTTVLPRLVHSIPSS